MPDRIDDCIQDVFLDLCNAISNDKTIRNPKAWLTTVANNKIKDIYSHAKKDANKLVPLEAEQIDNTYSVSMPIETSSVSEEEISTLKEEVINRLCEVERQLLIDRYELKKSISQIADEHNTTENNIYQKLFRLKIKTKMIIEKVLYG